MRRNYTHSPQFHQIHQMEGISVKTSVVDPFHFNTDPDPRIRLVEKRILLRIRPKIEKITTFYNLFSSENPKNYLLLYIQGE